MAETLTLASPITKPNQTGIRIDRITVDIEQKAISVSWLGNNGEAGSASYPTPAPAGSSQPTGAVLLATLNTANLTSNSLVKRVLTRLQTDGYIAAGSIAGTPD